MTIITCMLGGKRLSEAEVRMSLTDPIIKGIMRCTNTAVATEEPISKQPSAATSHPSSSTMATPTQQKTVSRDIVPDYAIHLLHCGSRFPVIALVELFQ